MIFFALLISGCACEPCENDSPKKVISEQHGRIDNKKSPYVDSLSEFILEHPKQKLTLSPGVNIDFQNFAYEDFILHNGVSYIDDDFGFDTVRHIKTHSFGDKLNLIELYEYYGGGSSEIMTILYLYRRDHDALTLLSSLKCDGSYPVQVKNGRIKVKADNYKGGESARCCPWKYEIGEFEITNDSLKYIGHVFEDIPE